MTLLERAMLPMKGLKLDSQRGAVVATEMKNNSAKLSKWTVQSILAGAEQLKIGYVLKDRLAESGG